MSSDPTGDAPIGRNEEFRQLLSLIDSLAERGDFAAACVLGSAGIGKTHLLDAVARRASALGIVVRTAIGDISDRTDPLATVRNWFGAAADFGVADAAGIATYMTANAADLVASELVVDAAEAAVVAGPLLVILDDAQLADSVSLAAVRALIDRARSLPIVVIVAARIHASARSPAAGAHGVGRNGGVPAASDIASLVAELSDVVVHLEPLDDSSLRSVVAAHGADVNVADIAVARAAGNPFFAIELIRHPRDDRSAARITDVLLARLAHLPDHSIAALQIASLLGNAFPQSELRTALGDDDDPASHEDSIDALLRAEILERRTDGALAFTHQLVRDAIAEDLPDAVVQALHAEVAAAFAGVDMPAGRVAYHYLRAADLIDGAARSAGIAVLRRAAVDASARAPAFAVECLERAAQLAGPNGMELQPELAFAYARAGRPRECLAALDAVEGALRDGHLTMTPTRRSHATALRVQAMLSLGAGADVALAALVDAIAEPDVDADARAAMLGDASFNALMMGDNDGAREYALAAVALEPSVRDRGMITDACCVLAWLEGYALRFDTASQWGERALEVARMSGAPTRARSTPEYFVGMVELDACNIDRAADIMRAGQQACEEFGVAWPRPLYSFGLAAANYLRGEWDAAVAEVETGVQIASELGSALGIPFGHSIGALIAIARDDIATATRHIEAANALDDVVAPAVGFDWLALAQVRFSVATGDEVAAYEHIAGAFDFDVALAMQNDLVDLAPDLVQLAMVAGDEDRVASTLAVMRDCAARAGLDHLVACAERIAAVGNDDGDAARRAVEAARRHQRLADRAATLGDCAVVIAGVDAASGREWLDEALVLWDEMGATREVARLLARAREVGLRSRRRAARSAARVGWDALSPTEREVGRLVSEGLTNRDISERMFVSRRTIESHVQHAFTKLGIRSRAELAAAVRGQEST